MACVTRAALLLSLTAALAVAAPAPPPALTYRFPVGENMRYAHEAKIELTMAFAGTEVAVTFVMGIESAWKGLGPPKGGETPISQTTGRVRLEVAGPEPIGEGEYDSKDGKMPPGPYFEKIGPMLKAMVGKATTLSVTAAGKVKSARVPKELADEQKKLRDEAAAAGVPSDALGALMGQGGLVMPNYTPGKGKVWETVSVAKAPGGKITTRTVFEHKGTEKRGGRTVEVIRITPTVTAEGDGTKAALKLKSSESSGVAYFDKEAGRLIESSVTMKMEVEMTVGGRAVTQKIDQTMTMKYLPE